MNELPDNDAMKLFIGQIPKSWNENDIRLYFEEFGRIYLINVLRDKITKQSRGCCFITYFTRKSALEAQNQCHNLKTLPGMNHPLQVKPADNENRHERKIFVGMLSKKLMETDIRIMFARFGLIEECSILRDANGISRGCGFVTFSSKASALNAIKAMHQSTIMESCSAPLVVKMADSQKDKPQAGNTSSILNAIGSDNRQYLSLLQLLQQQANSCGVPNPPPVPKNVPHNNISPLASLSNLSPTTDLATLTLLATLTANNIQPNSLGNHTGAGTNLSNLSNLNVNVLPTTSGASGNYSFPNIMPTMSSPPPQTTVLNNQTLTASKSNSSQIEGPDGSNLFIYHLPQEFTDGDLAQAFSPFGFGKVLSTKVFVDKTTNLSKCFGFVSYDNPLSAQLAIQAMNGMPCGPKRLKVQLKRSKDKPYW